MIRSRAEISDARRIVIKIGSSLLADSSNGVRQQLIHDLADVVAGLMREGKKAVIVSSGAVALGRVRLRWLDRRLSVHEQQAAAAVGQPELMRAYSRAFDRHGLCVAQMLLTKDDLRHRRRYLNACNTSETLFSVGVVPIVNENDTVMVEEIKFGDNDNLAALVSLAINADFLVMMTDVDGLYDRNPVINADAKRISVVDALTEKHFAMAGGSGSAFGTGGMFSKLKAARIAGRGGVASAIISGRKRDSLLRLLRGEDEGTLFPCSESRQSKRRHWIADVLKPAGRLHIDTGAANALLNKGGSLLPVGVTAVEGVFDKGECVEIVFAGRPLAKGLVNYTAEELRRIKGHASDEIESVLGYRDFSSVVHRDNLVIIDGESIAKEEES